MFKAASSRLPAPEVAARLAWLHRGEPVPTRHLINASRELKKPLRDIAERLLELGFRLPDGIAPTPADSTGPAPETGAGPRRETVSAGRAARSCAPANRCRPAAAGRSWWPGR
ncbi:hypothetical protein [Saccharothrix syringae]|uniref:wHTH domain-containing protein n=1 Tax=Saccharothrix syringae TaxID=103733 RepID=UPI000525EC63